MGEEIKYAVYSVGTDGNDSLSVVVDTDVQAKSEMEKLKPNNSCVKIKKHRVENFGAEGEKITDTQEVECWKKDAAADGLKLSGKQTTPTSQPEQLNVSSSPLQSPPVVTPMQKFWNGFFESYIKDGDLMGLGYGFFDSGNSASSSKPVESASAVEVKKDDATTNIISSVEGNEVTVNKSRLLKLKEEMKNISDEIEKIESPPDVSGDDNSKVGVVDSVGEKDGDEGGSDDGSED